MAQQEQERRSTLCQYVLTPLSGADVLACPPHCSPGGCRLLARNRNEFDIEYGGYLSNHMSHYLVALYELGGARPPFLMQHL
jgi:hypothetical protein